MSKKKITNESFIKKLKRKIDSPSFITELGIVHGVLIYIWRITIVPLAHGIELLL